MTLATGCGDDTCGPAPDSQQAIIGSLASEDIPWENWRSSPNNDCGEAGGPTSLTVEADQRNTVDRGVTLCLPRPERLSSSKIDVTDRSRVRIIDVFANVGEDCLASLDRGTAVSGTVAFPGLCENGLFDGGYSIALDVTLPMTIDCGGVVRTEDMVLNATASVRATSVP